jgi:50S ribosomal protein L16 3-hydroxylase
MGKHGATLTLLGGISPEHFLREYWQKKPLLIRQAIPQFTGILEPNDLAGLACEADVHSRIVSCKKDAWHLKEGPFTANTFAKLPNTNWTLLVQSVNHYLPEASELLDQFNFIPKARLDDLMVSYAPAGGSVGPHFDRYDVFLLQGTGKRLWQISAQTDLSLVENAPLSILKHFQAEQEWLLEAGDMLYLPPKFAHWGIAQASDDEGCMTYSIGFKAPKKQELATEFLGFLQDQFNQDTLKMHGIYEDADLVLQSNSAAINQQMIDKVSEYLHAIQWDNSLVTKFLGSYLTEPKMDVVFKPNVSISLKQFSKRILKKGIRLDLKSQLLFDQNQFFINGEAILISENIVLLMQQFADKRGLSHQTLEAISQETLDPFLAILYSWYLLGYCQLG